MKWGDGILILWLPLGIALVFLKKWWDGGVVKRLRDLFSLPAVVFSLDRHIQFLVTILLVIFYFMILIRMWARFHIHFFSTISSTKNIPTSLKPLTLLSLHNSAFSPTILIIQLPHRKINEQSQTIIEIKVYPQQKLKQQRQRKNNFTWTALRE